jgi:hypothetical protein
MLHISIYNEAGSQQGVLGSYGQVQYFDHAPESTDLRNILQAEVDGDFITVPKANREGFQDPSNREGATREHNLTSLKEQQDPLNKVSSFVTDDSERALADITRFQNNDGKILVLGR